MSKRHGAREALAWVGHPASVAAAMVLLINDHILKAAWPGWVTGKMSDIAGLVVAPALLATLVSVAIPRLPAKGVAVSAITLTGVVFAFVKTTAVGASIASDAWSVLAGPSIVLRDPTDLLALPALAVAWWVWRKARQSPSPDRVVRLLRVVVLLPITMLAVAATSYVGPEYPSAEAVVWTPSGFQLFTRGSLYDTENHSNNGRQISANGVDWIRVSYGEGPSGSVKSSDCVPGDPRHCYRLVNQRLQVEETVDGGATWRTAWSVSEGRRSFLNRVYEHSTPQPYGKDIAVGVAPDGGHVVVVANGRDGIAVREANGAWRRIGFLDLDGYGGDSLASPAPAQTQLGARLHIEFIIAVLVAGFVAAISSEVYRRRNQMGSEWVTLAILIGPLVFCVAPAFSLTRDGFYAPAEGLGLAGIAAWCVALLCRLVMYPRSWPYGLFGLLGGVLFIAPFLGWTVAMPDEYATAIQLAVGGAALSLVVGVIHALRVGPPRYDPTSGRFRSEHAQGRPGSS